MPHLLALLSLPAHAAGFYTPNPGTRAVARGGAFVAGANDLTAQFYNPAGLSRIEGSLASVNVTGVSLAATFEREFTDPAAGAWQTDPAVNEGPVFVIPSLGFATRFGLPNTVFALGLYPPLAPDSKYKDNGSQRYSIVDSTEWQAFGGPSVAHTFGETLTIGAGLAWTFLRAERTFYMGTCLGPVDTCSTQDDENADILVDLKALDPMRFTGNAGVLWEPNESWAVGASVQPPIKFKAPGSLAADLGEDHVLNSLVDLSATRLEDDEITLLLTFPLIARLGLAFRPDERTEIELMGEYQGWSSIPEIVVTDVNLQVDASSPLIGDTSLEVTDDVALKTGYRDSWAARLGGERRVGESLALRAGVFYETGALTDQFMSLASVDADKVGVGLGGGWSIDNGLTIDVGAGYNQFLVGDVTDNEAFRQVLAVDIADPAQSGIVEGDAVGAGTYDASILLLSGGVSWAF